MSSSYNKRSNNGTYRVQADWTRAFHAVLSSVGNALSDHSGSHPFDDGIG